MKVFKFGGASIKSAEAVKNMCRIVKNHSTEKLLVVVSAMGKTTNKLEIIVDKCIRKNDFQANLEELHKFHLAICHELFTAEDEVEKSVNELISALRSELMKIYSSNELYDQVVSYGELLSSLIISRFLQKTGVITELVDSRKMISTNSTFKNAQVHWELTQKNIDSLSPTLVNRTILTQGFLGGTENGRTTTLGREGSDYSAAIFAACLNAQSVTVWKDVPGILNADPKLISEAQLFSEIPYKEAAEMTYYGASVIHPKTIKPLANKEIPLYVKSFDNPEAKGTTIHNCEFKKPLSSIIIKHNQCLVSFQVLDYTFINEENLSLIFKKFALLDIKINIMQNSAISFSVVIDYEESKLSEMLLVLSKDFDVKYNTQLTLITIKNYNKEDIVFHRKNKRILLEQTSRNNYRALYSD